MKQSRNDEKIADGTRQSIFMDAYNHLIFLDTFNHIQKAVHDNARKKGWWDDDDSKQDGVKIALMHSELSEALEAMRQGNHSSENIPDFEYVTEELADVVIRIMDFCEKRRLDLAEAILAKHQYNLSRPFKHGGKIF